MSDTAQVKLRGNIKKHFKRELEGIIAQKQSGNKEYHAVLDQGASRFVSHRLR
jgi:hypothetical protein